MSKLTSLFETLRGTREKFSAAARALPEQHWRVPPRADAWSAAEVVAHVTMVETLMTGAAAKITRKPPVKVAHWKRIHLPVIVASWRILRVKSPIPLDMLLLDDRDIMLSRLAEQRYRTITVLEAGRGSNFHSHRINHPLLGSLHYYDWFRTLANHDLRHEKQLREIIRGYQGT